MDSVCFTAETSSDNGVIERDFTVGSIPGVLWSAGSDPAPVVLMGHGGGLHKKTPALMARALDTVTTWGFTVVAIDAPGHGERPRSAADERARDELRQAYTAGDNERFESVSVRYSTSLAERAVPEWQATLDALQELPEIGAKGPVGYWGLNMGTAIGVPLTAADPRITAAVFGLHWPDSLAEAASRITIPIEFDLQWDDEHIDRQSGLALFAAFASKEKTLHANAGAHKELPRFEADSAVRFFARHLGGAGASPGGLT